MPDSPLNNVNDFVWDENFRNWVLNPTEISDAYWQDWIALHPGSEDDISAARDIILSLKVVNKQFTKNERVDFVNETFKRATFNNNNNNNLNRIKFFVAAAVIIAVLFTGYYSFFHKKRANIFKETAKSFYYKNNRNNAFAIRLNDSTEIVLDAKASIRLDSAFGSRDRKVFLEGNAFFNVAKDSSKLFYVYCGDIETKVLGTSFKIQTDSGSKKVQVIVHTGIVSVSMPENIKGKKIGLKTIVVTRNQQADYSPKTGSLSKTITANPLESDANFIDFIYDAKPVYDIFSDLEKAYEINILYDKNTISNLEFSGNLQGKTLQEKIAILCTALGFHYKIDDGKILVF